MRTRTAVALTLVAAAVGACGGSTESTVPIEGAAPPATATATTQARGQARAGRRRGSRGDAQDCAAQGITAAPFNEGACVQDGTRFVVANGRSLLRLRTLDVAIRGFSVAEQLGAGRRVAVPQQGAFMVITLRVRNTTGQPQRFASGQVLLAIEQQRFEEATAAERAHPEALAGQDAIPPGGLATGVIVYDLPPGELDRVTREGVLLVANFGKERRGELAEVGQFRIGVA